MIAKLRKYNIIIDRISTIIGKIFSWLTLFLMLLVTFEVVMRYVFNKPTDWTMEVEQFMFLVIVAMGGAYVLSVNGHVNVDIIYNRFGVRTRAVIGLITYILAFGYFVFFIWQTWSTSMTSLAWRQTSGSAWNPPIYPIWFFIPVGGFFLFIEAISKVINLIIQLSTGIEEKQEAEDIVAGREDQ